MPVKSGFQYRCGQRAGAGGVLGRVDYGGGEALPGADLAVPLAVLPAPALVPSFWLAEEPLQSGVFEDCRYRSNEHLLFGAICLKEADFAASAGLSSLQQASRAAYDQTFAVLARTGFSRLVRCWNYIPAINQESGGLERYRQFNIGRQDAFLASGRSCTDNLPAASALGTVDGALYLYFLATRVAPQAIENPRQLSAYRYPERYGPRSPSFSRASLLTLPDCAALFISGTASIVGHESVHPGDVVAQTDETLNNIEALLAETTRLAPDVRLGLRDLDCKVFLRHPGDYAAVAGALERRLGSLARTLCVQADVCRSDLLVEIEAVGIQERP